MQQFRTLALQQLVRAGILAATSATCIATVLPAHAEMSVSQTQTYQIPAGTLATSLNHFASQAGITLTYDPALVSGKQAPVLNGQYTVESGLSRLIGNQSLQLINDGNQRYRIETIGGESVYLPKVDVSGRYLLESGRGPVNGFVAKRSITAAKADIPLIETPQAVNVVTADEIEIHNAESINQVLQYTPGVVPMGADSTTSDGMIIRGFNVTGASPFYLNGSKLPRNTFSGVSEPYAMERIEVLKGPASVLYGNAAPGGIVNMVSKLPETKTQRELKVQTGSFDRRQLAGDFTGALTEDGSLAYRLTGLYRDSDTMTDHVPDDRKFGQFSLRWQPTEATSLTLLSNFQNNDTTFVYGLPAEGTVLSNPNGSIDRDLFVGEPGFNEFKTRNHTLGYLFSHQFNDAVTFRQNVTYFDAETDYSDISIGTLVANQREIGRGAYTRYDENRTFTIDNQLETKWTWGKTEHTTLFGVDYTKNQFERDQYRGAVANLDLFNPVYGAPVMMNPAINRSSREDSKKLGIYAQEHLKIADRWVVMLGGRYDDFESDTDNKLTGASTDYEEDAYTGRAGLVYLFDNGFAPYASYSESFEPLSGQDASGQSFKPTEGEQYEVGLRYQPEGAPYSVSASLYKLTQKNVITADLANSGFFIQEGEVESKGFELEAKASLDQWNFTAAYAYIDNNVTESNTGTEGNRTNNVPRHMASAWADYQFTKALKGLGVGAGVRYIGETYNIANTVEVSSYTVVDAVINYTLSPQWKLALNINNLFDKEYATCSYACFYGVERSAYVTAVYNW